MDELVENAVGMMERQGRPRAGWQGGIQLRDGELIEGPEYVTFILQAPGYWEEDLRVTVSGGKLEVRAPDFTAKTQLPPEADVSRLRSRYTNGVLEVRVGKLQ